MKNIDKVMVNTNGSEPSLAKILLMMIAMEFLEMNSSPAIGRKTNQTLIGGGAWKRNEAGEGELGRRVERSGAKGGRRGHGRIDHGYLFITPNVLL